MDRRTFLMSVPALGVSTLAAPALAQNAFPEKPIRVVCGSTAGALLDAATRLYSDRMSKDLKQPLIVENLAGASSLLAARAVLRAPADGYTLLTVANTLISMPHFSKAADYKLADFTPIGEMARSPSVLIVSAESSFKSVADVIAVAKSTPGQVTFASGGQGTVSHLPSEFFMNQAGIKLVHVPYKGVAPAVADVVANRVGFMLATPTSVAGLVKTGRLRILAITSAVRSPVYPDVPTFKELGWPDATFEIWVGIFGPANMPANVRDRIAQAMEVARNDAGVRHKLEELGQSVSDVRTPQAFDAFIQAEDKSIAKLIKAAHIRPD